MVMVGPCGLHNWSASRTENEWLIVPSMAALLHFYSGDIMGIWLQLTNYHQLLSSMDVSEKWAI